MQVTQLVDMLSTLSSRRVGRGRQAAINLRQSWNDLGDVNAKSYTSSTLDVGFRMAVDG
jgi:hypothetical protein